MVKVLSYFVWRRWLRILLAIWVVFLLGCYWWLMSHISTLETQNRVYRSQLRMSHQAVKYISVDSDTTYIEADNPDLAGTLCETIHVSLVCMGKCPREVTPMLKSLLHHRQNPLHFHMIVDGASEYTISKLFDTWDLPDVKYTCYNAEHNLAQVQWIPNRHYSGVFTLVKLLYPQILPDSLQRVIFLDSDLTFLCDIAELWALFKNMNEEQFIGLVENESNWYYENNHWPALGRGFNTGVMLLDLHKIRAKQDWTELWHRAVTDNLYKLKHTYLADQDVINAVIKEHPNIVFHISCQYNVQMSTKSLAKNCYGEDRNNVKILHWNSPSKHSIKIRDADYFRTIYQSYSSFDGNLLREKLHRCWHTDTVTQKPNTTDLCETFRAAQRIKLRTHLHFMDYSYKNVDNFDVTLVLQLSMDRLQFLERLVKHWEGPLSAAIYLADCELSKLESFIKDWSDTLSSRSNIGYHLVFKHDKVHYPVNYLRNVALENVNTPYVFLMDVDFVPMSGLYEHLRTAIRLINPYPQKKCLVVPAFETRGYRAMPPRTKPALVARLAPAPAPRLESAPAPHLEPAPAPHLEPAPAPRLAPALRAPDVASFRASEWPRGHRATNYTRWIHATKPYEVEWEADYEPYLVVHRSVPKYDVRFSGFGWNKVSHIVELNAQGYKAVVLPDAFVVHTTHAPSQDILAFRADRHYRICLALLKQEFLEDLKRKYNVTFDSPAKSESIFLSQAKSLIYNQAKDKG